VHITGRLTRTAFADSAFETYAYFGDGLLQSKTDRKNQTIQYAYDHLKRLSTKSYPNLTSISYSYLGQKLTQVSDTSVSPSETHTFSYDNQYRVASNAQASRGTIGYTYDAADRTTSHTITAGPTASYTFYPDGSLNTIQWTPITGQFKYAYTLSGKYGTVTFPNGQTRTYSYDDQGRLLQLANAHPTVGNLATYAYGYDLNNSTGSYTMLGQRTGMTATVPAQSFSSALTGYYYDNVYQLTRVDYPNVAPFNAEIDSWTYDAIGNRLTNTVNGATTNYTYQKIGTNPNNWQRLTSDGTSAYTYDANGSTATKTGSTFGWDYENRMTSISGTPNASYGYDYSGRRGSKTVAGTATSYLYDGLNLVSETSGSTTYHLFGPGIDEPLASSRAGSLVYEAVDALGTVALTRDPAGAAQNSYVFDAWGVSRSVTEAFPQPFRYTARETGDTAEVLFYRGRYYAPATGRFLSEDALRLRATPNFYEYADNRPVSRIDALGLTATPAGQCGTTDCSVYASAHRLDLYYICKAFPDSPKPNCVRKCLLTFFDPSTRPVGTYPDPPIFFNVTMGAGADAANGLVRLYGPVSHITCFQVCHYGPF
jgi:RHS repeat-associated protein